MNALGDTIFAYLEEECELKVRFLGRVYYGKYVPKDECDEITINVWTAIAVVVVHEWMHSRYPDWSEDEVRANENKYLSKLTREEIIRLANYVLSKI